MCHVWNSRNGAAIWYEAHVGNWRANTLDILHVLFVCFHVSIKTYVFRVEQNGNCLLLLLLCVVYMVMALSRRKLRLTFNFLFFFFLRFQIANCASDIKWCRFRMVFSFRLFCTLPIWINTIESIINLVQRMNMRSTYAHQHNQRSVSRRRVPLKFREKMTETIILFVFILYFVHELRLPFKIREKK